MCLCRHFDAIDICDVVRLLFFYSASSCLSRIFFIRIWIWLKHTHMRFIVERSNSINFFLQMCFFIFFFLVRYLFNDSFIKSKSNWIESVSSWAMAHFCCCCFVSFFGCLSPWHLRYRATSWILCVYACAAIVMWMCDFTITCHKMCVNIIPASIYSTCVCVLSAAWLSRYFVTFCCCWLNTLNYSRCAECRSDRHKITNVLNGRSSGWKFEFDTNNAHI